MKERTKLILQRRIAGESYQSIAKGLGIRVQTARVACLRAMWKGVVTPDQIRYSHNQKAPTDEEYNALWLARLAEKSRPAANGCIEVVGVFHNEDGYAIVKHRRLGQFAHRVVVILKGRPIPPGYMACHSCGNHGCVNDEHLYVGTMKDNARDTVAMGRHRDAIKTECIHGHPFTPENTRITSEGKRQCIECGRARHREKWRHMTPEQRAEFYVKRNAYRRGRRQKSDARMTGTDAAQRVRQSRLDPDEQ